MVTQSRGRSDRAAMHGEVWLAALDPMVGSEVQKTRPCLVVSPPEMNDRLRTIMSAPLTTGGRPAPSRIAVLSHDRAGLVLLDPLPALGKSRVICPLGVILTVILRRTSACWR